MYLDKGCINIMLYYTYINKTLTNDCVSEYCTVFSVQVELEVDKQKLDYIFYVFQLIICKYLIVFPRMLYVVHMYK